MSIKPISQSFELSDGRSVTIETGKLAKQADGSVVVKMGKTMLMATVVAAPEAREDVDFLPLSVDYKEKYAAAGKFPGGFFKREARPSEYEILICRLIDRALRPLFPNDFHAETQMLVQLISVEEDVSPDALAALAASSALMVSDIPFNGPISEVRVARVNGEFVINPSISQQEEADIELIVAASLDNIMMVEGEMEEVSEAEMLSAIKVAHEAIKIQCQAQIDLAAKVEKAAKKREYCHEVNDDDLRKQVKEATYQKCYDISKAGNADKHFRSSSFRAVRDEFLDTFDEEKRDGVKNLVKRYFHDVEKEAVRDAMIAENIRLDGRKMDEIRPIWTEVDYLPSAHGSAIFTRGETQSLVSVTLGSKLDEQKIDGAVISGKRNFLLHYNFPPFSTGEVKRMMGVSRREVGHGNLAERALKYVIPKGEDNPYTIRIVSDILESNGSSSMASVCGGTLALMDAGINISKPVAGIAMGLISDYNSDKYVVLSDILGDEDHLGDMDFKVTGTQDGITACQMDIKVDGLSYEILEQALEQARNGRIHILNEMAKTLDAPRKDYKDNAPRIEKMVIEKEFIGAVIGPGGKVIQEIQAETGATIVIEEVDEKGVIDIMADNKATIEAAKDWIKGIVAVPEVNEVYLGTVKSIVAFGAFVEILPGKDGLLHISEIDHKRINNVEDVLKQGDKIKVKLIEVDKRSGKLKLSRKALIPKPEHKEEN
ncbi:MAG: polyribonucleotide nucleotidyltransferase [Bacteroidales bacterium]|nr:polyribonucleotide nucleotidyltransferase [Lentimicrobiaceae bacterium]MDG1136577.1 polyribonucleotide nucleotidyltransferase [Bacteroidales bacterium]MDG1901593.1 polyribonucleotide nucleotidyltransferase [Bacteroidales bacterium]MDG2081642.1 polyribonucleotide nucleotidyltransferase [Bacteroidales bacterium]